MGNGTLTWFIKVVVTIPYFYFKAADEIMLSADVSDPGDKIVIDFIAFRDLAYPEK